MHRLFDPNDQLSQELIERAIREAKAIFIASVHEWKNPAIHAATAQSQVISALIIQEWSRNVADLNIARPAFQRITLLLYLYWPDIHKRGVGTMHPFLDQMGIWPYQRDNYDVVTVSEKGVLEAAFTLNRQLGCFAAHRWGELSGRY